MQGGKKSSVYWISHPTGFVYQQLCSITHLTRLKVQTSKQIDNLHACSEKLSHRARLPPSYHLLHLVNCRWDGERVLQHNLGLLIRSQNVTYFNAALTKEARFQWYFWRHFFINLKVYSKHVQRHGPLTSPLLGLWVLVRGCVVVCRQKEQK